MISFRQDERTLATYHRHKIVLFFETVPIVFFLCIVFGFTIFGVSRLTAEMAPLVPLVILGALFFINLFWIVFFAVLSDFYLDVWIITNKRVISVEQKGFFSRTISEFELSKVQDVTTGVHGIIATLLNYGDLVVRTASEHQDFVFKQVWRPDIIKDTLLKAVAAYQSESNIKN